METHVIVKIIVDDNDSVKCSRDCDFNDCGHYCQLYAKELVDNNRCETCVDGETDFER